MKITIVGGGNIGTQFAVHCAEKNHEVTIFTSQPDLFSQTLSIVDENGAITHQGDIHLATQDPQMAFQYADLILVTVPAMIMKSAAEKIFIHAREDAIIGVVPGNGGSECAFSKCIQRGNIFFGIERVPAIARLVQKGKIVKSTGYRDELHIAAFPKNAGVVCANIVSRIFDMKTVIIPNFLNLTMTPSNPILHTSRLYSLFFDWHNGMVYKSVPLFYEEWNDHSSELLLLCDAEVQAICRALPELELKFVKSLKDHYESWTVEAMTKKISTIQAFKGIKTPMIAVDGGFVPDLHSRYFTADFSYGLSIIKQIAEFAKVNTPTIDMILGWYDRIAVEKERFKYSDYGINSAEEFMKFYLR